jgi:hypothetical protein
MLTAIKAIRIGCRCTKTVTGSVLCFSYENLNFMARMYVDSSCFLAYFYCIDFQSYKIFSLLSYDLYNQTIKYTLSFSLIYSVKDFCIRGLRIETFSSQGM